MTGAKREVACRGWVRCKGCRHIRDEHIKGERCLHLVGIAAVGGMCRAKTCDCKRFKKP